MGVCTLHAVRRRWCHLARDFRRKAMQHELQLSTDCQRDMTSSQMQHVVKLCGMCSRRQLTKFGKAHHHAPLIRLRRMALYKFVLID